MQFSYFTFGMVLEWIPKSSHLPNKPHMKVQRIIWERFQLRGWGLCECMHICVYSPACSNGEPFPLLMPGRIVTLLVCEPKPELPALLCCRRSQAHCTSLLLHFLSLWSGRFSGFAVALITLFQLKSHLNTPPWWKLLSFFSLFLQLWV